MSQKLALKDYKTSWLDQANDPFGDNYNNEAPYWTCLWASFVGLVSSYWARSVESTACWSFSPQQELQMIYIRRPTNSGKCSTWNLNASWCSVMHSLTEKAKQIKSNSTPNLVVALMQSSWKSNYSAAQQQLYTHENLQSVLLLPVWDLHWFTEGQITSFDH